MPQNSSGQIEPRGRLSRFGGSLVGRLTLLVGVITAVICIANGVMSHRALLQVTEATLTRFAQAALVGFGDRSTGALRFGDTASLQLHADQLRALAGGDLLHLVVTGPDGTVVAGSGTPSPAEAEGLTALAQSAGPVTFAPRAEGGFTAGMAILAPDGQTRLGGIATTWTMDSALAAGEAARLEGWVLAFALFVVMLALAGVLLRHRIGRPLQALGAVVDTLARGGYDDPVPALGSRDELGRLAAQVATLRDRLREARDRESDRHRDQRLRMAELEEQERVVEGLREGLSALSRHDLSFRLLADFPATYDPLRRDFNQVVSALSGVMSQVLETTRGVTSGADEIAGSSDDLSRRTESQAATLEQTAASLEAIVAGVTDTAANARKAEQIAVEADRQARVSEGIVRGAVEAMAEIETSAREIAQIIKLIEDFAFQTNLLALNAGVEAARAGEAGRGFAVVATEVRALAQRSAHAAQEIKTLVGSSSAQITNGVTLVREAGEAMSGFTTQLAAITGLMSGIAASTDRQVHSLSEMNTGVTALDQVTQRNAAMVEETSAALHELRRQARVLHDSLSTFRLAPPPALLRIAAE